MMSANELQKVPDFLNEVIDALQSRTLLNKLGLAQIRKIKSRTRAGLDLEGKPFKAYNEKYAERKEKLTGIPTDVVNLVYNDIDGMMASIDHVVASDLKSVALTFTKKDRARIAQYHNELGAGKSRVIRQFWGVSEQDSKDIAGIVQSDLDLLLQKLSE